MGDFISQAELAGQEGGRIPSGIRCVVWIPNAEQRASVLLEVRKRASVVVVGVTGDRVECAKLLDEFVPEVLIATASDLPAGISGEGSTWPILMSVGTTPVPESAELRSALEATIQKVFSTKATELRELMTNYLLAYRAQPLSAFNVIDEGEERTIPSEEVRFITVDGNYAKLHTSSGQFRVRETLNSLAISLDSQRFVRIHRSIIVNLNFVDRVLTRAQGGASLVLRDRTHLPVGPSFSIPAGIAV